jgi:hypothetical protein
LDDRLTVDDRCLATDVGSRANDRRIVLAPIKSIAGKYAGSPPLKQDLAAIAVLFEFVNPVLPLWWLIDGESELRLDEPEPICYANHARL